MLLQGELLLESRQFLNNLLNVIIDFSFDRLELLDDSLGLVEEGNR